MKVSKRLTSKSGITIPKQLRAELGFTPGMAVDMETTSKGVLLYQHRPTCRFCGRIEDVVTVAQMQMCRACAAALKQEVTKHGI